MDLVRPSRSSPCQSYEGLCTSWDPLIFWSLLAMCLSFCQAHVTANNPACWVLDEAKLSFSGVTILLASLAFRHAWFLFLQASLGGSRFPPTGIVWTKMNNIIDSSGLYRWASLNNSKRTPWLWGSMILWLLNRSSLPARPFLWSWLGLLRLYSFFKTQLRDCLLWEAFIFISFSFLLAVYFVCLFFFFKSEL